MSDTGYLQTGQVTCHDAGGCRIDCSGSGQDAAFRHGTPWPEPRFKREGGCITDRLTGLVWHRNANLAEFPLTWQEALDFVIQMNCDRHLGESDWRLPNRHELRSLISHQTRRPALPENHPFTHVFNGWYWTATTAAISPAHAWYVDMDGGRMFYGGKDQSFMVWPVRGQAHRVLPVTGQTRCYSGAGDVIPCTGSGQDADWSCGCPWPSLRFHPCRDGVIDRLTGLCWYQPVDLRGPVTWAQALSAVDQFNTRPDKHAGWRLPNINELESLVDCSRHSPALPTAHPFNVLHDAYWSSTTSLYERDWAWALYLNKGAVGVGQKTQAKFHVWPVRDQDSIVYADE